MRDGSYPPALCAPPPHQPPRLARRGGFVSGARSMTLCDLGGAIGADGAESLEFMEVGRLRVVATAECAVSDEPTVAPPLGGGDVPDVLIGALHANRRLRAKLFCHRASLRSQPGSSGRASKGAVDPVLRTFVTGYGFGRSNEWGRTQVRRSFSAPRAALRSGPVPQRSARALRRLERAQGEKRALSIHQPRSAAMSPSWRTALPRLSASSYPHSRTASPSLDV